MTQEQPQFYDYPWEVGQTLINPAEAGLVMGYPLYAKTPDGKKLIAVLRSGDLNDLANSKLIGDARKMLFELEYLLIDLQSVLAAHCNSNLHTANDIAPSAEEALQLVTTHDPEFVDPALYALIDLDEEDEAARIAEEEAEDEEDALDDEEEDDDEEDNGWVQT